MNEGTVVIVPTGQAGTLVSLGADMAQVLLANGEMWTGEACRLMVPQTPEHLALCPVNVSRPEPKRKKAKAFID